jgi:ubiquitin-protein ligase
MPRPSPRLRRLNSDHNALTRLRSESTVFDFVSSGDPPDRYLVKFKGRGLVRSDGSSRITIATEHHVSIGLGASYPRLMPELQWKTPLFHPNVSGSGVVCLGGYGTYWVPSLNLDELCEMLWDMLRYANYDTNSPYNRDAANWARIQTDFRFPIDPRPIRDRVASGQVEASGVPATKAVAKAATQPAPVVDRGAAQPVMPVAAGGAGDILFLDGSNDDIVDAEVVEGDDDVLVIE